MKFDHGTAAMSRAYEMQRRNGLLPATWEVIHASSWGSERRTLEDQDLARETVIPLSALRTRAKRGPG